VDFRFGSRYGDATTAFESGMLLYSQKLKGGELKPEYVGLDALLIKEDGKWQIMMEYQKGLSTKAEWDALAPAE